MTLCQSWQSSAQLRQNLAKLAKARQSSNAFKAKFFYQSLCKACLAKKRIQIWCYRLKLLAGAFGLVWGTSRPHIGLGQQINFHSHFRPKMGIVKKYHEKSILVPKHVSGVYKHHGTLKLCSESFYTLLHGGFRSFMNLNFAS